MKCPTNLTHLLKLSVALTLGVAIFDSEESLAYSAEKSVDLTRSYVAARRHQQSEEKLTLSLSELANHGWQQGFEPADFSQAVKTDEIDALFSMLTSRVVKTNKSRLYDTIKIPQLVPESIAILGERLFIGSLKQGDVFVKNKHSIEKFISGDLPVYGIKVHNNKLWVLTNGKNNDSWLKIYDVNNRVLISKYSVSQPSELNDLVIVNNTAYITDTKNGRVLTLPKTGETLVAFHKSEKLKYPNGITSNGYNLFVATLDGIVELALKDKSTRILKAPKNQSLAGIDGLYFHKNALYAIQNAVGQSRVIKFTDISTTLKLEILEVKNPTFDIPTTGVITKSDFLYIANSQLLALDQPDKIKLDTYILRINL